MQGLLLAFQDFWRENAGIYAPPFGYAESYSHIVLQAFLQRVINGGGEIIREMALGKGALTVVVLMLSVVGMVASDSVRALPPMHVIACLGAMALVLFGVLTQKEAFASFDFQAVFLLAFMPPLGTALVKTGAAAAIADGVVRMTGGSGPYVLTGVLWIAVWVLTQLMSNTATCALFCPIGWSVATSLGADPRAVVISVLIASSVGVCTPLAIPANMLILEPGNLRFRDFFAGGLAVSAVAFVLSMLLLPRLYPFFP